jgi:hypothetical protein
MKAFPYLLLALLAGCTFPATTGSLMTHTPLIDPRWVQAHSQETSEEYLARMIPDPRKFAKEEVATRMGDSYIRMCKNKNPELGRKLLADHEKFLAEHPLPHDYSPVLPVIIITSPDPDPNGFAEAQRMEQQFHHDEEIRARQELFDWALERLGR